jgi:hypothetical protein
VAIPDRESGKHFPESNPTYDPTAREEGGWNF